jgi:3-hydroxymyristoyl/3-hydroxydecanoyl-(acyl carrier protein) dehydratase
MSAFVIEVDRTIAADHPAFPGHFPDAPVLPGACLLALVLQAVAGHAGAAAIVGALPQVQQVKFLAPVGPGERLAIRLAAVAGGIDFEVHCGGRAVARGRLVADAAA